MISTEKKIQIMNEYKDGANVLLRRVGAQHWTNVAVRDKVQFNWSTNEYKSKRDFSEPILNYVRNLDFSSLPNPDTLKAECVELLYEAFYLLDVNKIVIKQSEHFFVNLMDYENDKVMVGIYYFSQKFNFNIEATEEDGIIDTVAPVNNSIQLIPEAEYQALSDEARNDGTTYLTY